MDFMNGLGPAKWIILGSIALVVIWTIGSMCKNLFSNKSKYKKSKKVEILTKEELSALNMGAIVFQSHKFLCDSLETGLSRTEKQIIPGHILYDYYKVLDTESAIQMLTKLEGEIHETAYKAIIPVLTEKSLHFDLEGYEEILNSFGDESEKNKYVDDLNATLSAYVDNIKETFDILKKNKYVNSYTDFDRISIIGWDMGRLVIVARLSHECKFITAEEAWAFINAGYEKCKQHYTTWEEFAKGYMVGRAMWGGLGGDSIIPLFDITKALLTDTDSPWMENPFK